METATHNASQKILKASYALRQAITLLAEAPTPERVPAIPESYQAELDSIVERLAGINAELRERQPTTGKCVGGCSTEGCVLPGTVIPRPGLAAFLDRTAQKPKPRFDMTVPTQNMHGCGW